MMQNKVAADGEKKEDFNELKENAAYKKVSSDCSIIVPLQMIELNLQIFNKPVPLQMIEFNLILKAAGSKDSSNGFWKLLIETVLIETMLMPLRF